jgi:hypothetical protein
LHRKLIVGAVAMLAAAVVYPVMARVSVTMTVQTLSAQLVGSCANGSQVWQVADDVKVDNSSSDTATYQTTGFFTKFAQPGNPGQIQNNVTVIDAGGFVPGAYVSPGATGDYKPVLQVTLPCDASDASMFAETTLVGGTKTYQAGDPFLQSGTPVPVGATGIFGLAIVIAALGLLGQRLSRRPRTRTSA